MTQLRKLPAVEEQFQSAKTTIYKRVKNGTLPPPMHLGEKSSAWIAAELDAVLAAQVVGARDTELRALVVALVATRARQATDAAALAGVRVGNDEQELGGGADGRQPAA
jgi:prophage regulatory protein